jgi:hypothetical protein
VIFLGATCKSNEFCDEEPSEAGGDVFDVSEGDANADENARRRFSDVGTASRREQQYASRLATEETLTAKQDKPENSFSRTALRQIKQSFTSLSQQRRGGVSDNQHVAEPVQPVETLELRKKHHVEELSFTWCSKLETETRHFRDGA